MNSHSVLASIANPKRLANNLGALLSHTFGATCGTLPRLVHTKFIATSTAAGTDCSAERFPVFPGSVRVPTSRTSTREQGVFIQPNFTTADDNPLGLGATGEAGLYRPQKTWCRLSREDDLSAR